MFIHTGKYVQYCVKPARTDHVTLISFMVTDMFKKIIIHVYVILNDCDFRVNTTLADMFKKIYVSLVKWYSICYDHPHERC